MAIHVQHTYSAKVDLVFQSEEDYALHEIMTGIMDDICEHCCDVLIQHNFISAHVCDANTGEILMILKRS